MIPSFIHSDSANRTCTAQATASTPAGHPRAAARCRRTTADFIVLGELGRGGMGIVSRAWDRRRRRIVALKQLAWDTPGARRRLEREARLAATLCHPGIVSICDVGHFPDGSPYVVMELVRGSSLRALIKRATSLEERLPLLEHVRCVCDAMAYTHERAIVHRDLKPSNIMVARRGGAVIVDWGLARNIRSERRDAIERPDGRVDGAAALCGTPMYMAPEQANYPAAVDARADVFALGAVLYHLVSGSMPFDSSTIRARRERGAAVEPARLSAVSPSVPRALAAVVERAMASDPRHRFADAGQLGRALDRAIERHSSTNRCSQQAKLRSGTTISPTARPYVG